MKEGYHIFTGVANEDKGYEKALMGLEEKIKHAEADFKVEPISGANVKEGIDSRGISVAFQTTMLTRRKKGLPHRGVFTRLAPSEIHGVGVFAVIDIPKGTDIFGEKGCTDDDFLEVPEATVRAMPDGPLKQLYFDFCVLEDGVFYCPESFNEMSISWYLNNSENPNCQAEAEGIYFTALRNIKAGEELTVSYESYSEEP
jgi:SET domain-containing protein